jgi:hypothetical protein
VSRVVTELVAGAGLKFTELGSYELKGLPGSGSCLRRAIETEKTASGPTAK